MSILAFNNSVLPNINGSALVPTTPGIVWSYWSAAGTHSGTMDSSTSMFWVDPSKGVYGSSHDINIPLISTSTYNVPAAWTSAGIFMPPDISYEDCLGFRFKYVVNFSLSGRVTAMPTEGRWMAQPHIHSIVSNVEPNNFVGERNSDIRWCTEANQWDYYQNLYHGGAAGYSDSSGRYRRIFGTASGYPRLTLHAGPTATGVRTTAICTANSVVWSASGYLSAGRYY